MKKAKQEQTYNIDEIEDLTLFANESFDTQEVDLFEFSSEESSPLVRLKSIILSLDWEISDETLQELANELPTLQATWQGDKVAEVYLQGLEKIGRYIRNKGAYAHPNSIKLLLTFFYNFEKIVSSEHLSGEEITKILKGDVRKFKILQYQINQLENAPEYATAMVQPDAGLAPAASGDSSGTDSSPLKLLKAAILSLDWEVTDDNLKQFNEWLHQYRESVADNKLVMVLVQGLQALGEYIGTERAEAHPEAFTLLHSFSDALDQVALASEEGPGQKKAQDILVEQINRLNNLKLLIAAPRAGQIDEQAIEEVVGEISSPSVVVEIEEESVVEAPTSASLAVPSPPSLAEIQSPVVKEQADQGEQSEDALQAELDSLFGIDAKPAMESADIQYPDEILPPEAIQPVDDELADDLIEASLHSKRGLMPALSDVEATPAFHETDEPVDNSVQVDLNQQLDMLFAEVERGESGLSSSDDDLGEQPPDEAVLETPAPALAEGEADDKAGDDDEEDLGNASSQGTMIVAALSDAEEPEDRSEVVATHTGTDEELDKISAKLDSFFDLDIDEETEAAPAMPQDTVPADMMADEDLTVAALSDVSEEIPVDQPVPAPEPEEDLLDLESNLESFFKEEVTPVQAEERLESLADASAEEAEQSLYFTPDKPMETALAESEEEKGFSEEEASIGLEFTPLDEIEDKLDFFFDNETAETEVENDLSAPTETTVEEVSAVPSDLFADPDEDQEEDTAPALASFDAEPPTKDEIAAAVAGGTNESGDEIEGNLDFFFAEKSEQEPTAAGEKSEIEEMLGLEEEMPVLVSDLFDEIEVEEAGEAPASAAETDAETLEPLVQAGQESGLNRELEGELDLFFADEVEVQKPIPETVNELTEALEATIDSADENEVLLASLGTILPGIVRTPGRASIEEALRLLDTFQRQAVSAEQRSLAGLLNSTVSLLGRTAGKDKTETEKLINYLYESLARKGTDAGSVPEAVSRFTEWMRNLCATMPMIPERSGAAEEPRFEYTARELYFELAELRASIRDELAKLRHEMHHRA